MASPLKKIRYRLEWVALVVLAKIVPLLSRKSCFGIGNFLGACAFKLDARGRRVALSNLEAALGSDLSSRRRTQVARASYQQFVRTMLDLFWVPRLTSENFHQSLELIGFDETFASVEPGQGIIFTTFHYGNFEWGALILGLRRLRGVTLAQEFKNPLLEPVFAKLRKHSGNELAPRARGIVRMYKALKRGEHLALVTDLTLKPWDPSVTINCFGMKKCVTYAHAWLHQRTGAPIVQAHCQPLPDGRCRVHFFPKLQFPKGTSIVEITQRCWDQLEPVVRQNPAPWVWMYKHWRYRLAGSAKPYPFYAEAHRGFERRLNAAIAKLEREVVR